MNEDIIYEIENNRSFIKGFFREDSGMYRIGDLVHLKNPRAFNDFFAGFDRFGDTIGMKYLIKTKELNAFPDIKCLKEIIDEHISVHNLPIPKKNDLVVHVRLGDRKRLFIKEIEKITNLLTEYCSKNKEIDQIVIVTALHIPHNPGSKTYPITDDVDQSLAVLVELVKSLSLSLNLPIQLKSSIDIDEDLCYLCKATHLAVSKGGFSRLAAMYKRDSRENVICMVDKQKRKLDCLGWDLRKIDIEYRKEVIDQFVKLLDNDV